MKILAPKFMQTGRKSFVHVDYQLVAEFRNEIWNRLEVSIHEELIRRLKLIQLSAGGLVKNAARLIGVKPEQIRRWRVGKDWPRLNQTRRIDLAYWDALKRCRLGNLERKRILNNQVEGLPPHILKALNARTDDIAEVESSGS